MEKIPHQIYSFDEFRLDTTRGCLIRGRNQVKLRPKSFDALTYLVENSGRLVTKEELIKAVWPDAFVTEDSLVKCVKDVRQALEDESQKIIKTVPRRGYIFNIDVNVLDSIRQSTIYTEETSGVHVVIEERTNGFEPVQSANSSKALEAPTSKATNVIKFLKRRKVLTALTSATAATMVVAGIIFYKPLYAWWFKAPSIAVLPTVNATGVVNDDYISDGWTESLITSLAQLNQPGNIRLRVMALNTVFAFKGKAPLSVGRELEADMVLASKMTLEGNLRVFRFELIKVADGSVAWSKQYSYGPTKIDDFLAIQNTIPNDVVGQLPISLNDSDKLNLTRRYTQNPQAYDAYLKGRAAFHQVTPSSLKMSIEYYQQATNLDPNFAVAYWAMGVTYAVQAATGLRPNKEAQERAAELNQRALGIDSTLRAAASRLSDVGVWNWEAIGKAGPSHPGYSFPNGGYLIGMGRLEEQLNIENRRLVLEPYNPLANFWHGHTLFLARRYDEAITQYQKTLSLSPDGRIYVGVGSPWIHWALGHAYLQKGMFAEALTELNKCREVSEDAAVVRAAIGYAYAKSGRKEEAIKILEQLSISMAGDEYVPPLGIAWIHIGLGDNERAFDWLEKAFDERAIGLAEIKTNPIFDPLRTDPRLTELIRRIGLPV